MDVLQRGPFAFKRPDIDADDDFAWEVPSGPGQPKVTVQIGDIGKEQMPPMMGGTPPGGSPPAIMPVVMPSYHQMPSVPTIFSMPPALGVGLSFEHLISKIDTLVSGLGSKPAQTQAPLHRRGVRTYSPLG